MTRTSFTARILVITCVAHTITHLVMLVFAPIKDPMALEFGSAVKKIAFYFAIANVFFGLGAVPAGWLSDRFGEKWLLLAFFLLCAAGTGIIGLAKSTLVLATGTVVMGIATSIYHPVANALIAKGIEKRGVAMGINGVAGSIGTALGPLYGGVVASYFSWRESFLTISIPCILFGIALLFVDLGPASKPVPKKSATESQLEKIEPGPRGLFVVLFVFLISAMTLGGLFYYMFTTILPEYLLERGAIDNAGETLSLNEQSRIGGWGAFVALMFGVVGQMAGGILSDRVNTRKLYVAIYVLITPLVFALAFLDGFAALAGASIASVIYFAVQPIENNIIAQFTPARWKGTVYGLKFIVLFSISGGLGTWGVKGLEQDGGLKAVFLICGAAVTAALICATVAMRINVKEP